MKLKYLYKKTEDILRRIDESEGQYSWKFEANPACCKKCLELDGYIAKSDRKPEWYGHVPEEPGRFNCKCDWRLLEGDLQ